MMLTRVRSNHSYVHKGPPLSQNVEGEALSSPFKAGAVDVFTELQRKLDKVE